MVLHNLMFKHCLKMSDSLWPLINLKQTNEQEMYIFSSCWAGMSLPDLPKKTKYNCYRVLPEYYSVFFHPNIALKATFKLRKQFPNTSQRSRHINSHIPARPVLDLKGCFSPHHMCTTAVFFSKTPFLWNGVNECFCFRHYNTYPGHKRL